MLKLIVYFYALALSGCAHSQDLSLKDGQKVSVIRSDFKKGEIENLCNQAVQGVREQLQSLILALSAGQVPSDFNHTYRALDMISYQFNDTVEPLAFMANVHSSKAIRDEASVCEEKSGQFFTELHTNKKIFDLIKKVKSENPDEKRLIQKMNQNFERNGMALSDEKLEEFRNLKNELTSLETEFSKNINEDVSSLAFSEDELTGAPKSFLSRLEKDMLGRYIVTTKKTDYKQVMERVSVEETRKAMLLKYNQRGGIKNIEIFSRALEIRQKIASLLNYKSWADYQTQGRMAKNADAVWQFYSSIRNTLIKKRRSDLKKLLVEKKKENPLATELYPWDVSYYYTKVMSEKYKVDDEFVRQFFPKDHVMSGIFDIFSKLFSISIEEVAGARVWDENVKLYVVRDLKTQKYIASFYTDFIPRNGKYSHAAAFTLVKGRLLANGEYNYPVSAIVANFTPPEKGKPALLNHDEVETLFHEFGHILHQVLTKAPYGRLAGTNVAKDFVEAPSQMLEEWAWDKEVLLKISGHYAGMEIPLPEAVIDQMIAARKFNQGYFNARQMYLGILDMTLHTQSSAANILQINRDLHKEIMGMDVVEGETFPSSFGHIMGSYDAGYYGYLWSQVFAADMFSLFKDHGVLNSDLGMKYRSIIYEQGGMKDELDLSRSFLGRSVSPISFYKKMGFTL